MAGMAAGAAAGALAGSAGRNQQPVKCAHCGSKILETSAGLYTRQQFDLPLIRQKDIKVATETESVFEFWQVNDMYTFENIGFTQTVDDKKYLSCADCEMGPIGYHDLTTKHSFVALSRVA